MNLKFEEFQKSNLSFEELNIIREKSFKDFEIKGFPTLYTFVEVDGKMVGQPFSPRDHEGITSELQKRTQALN